MRPSQRKDIQAQPVPDVRGVQDGAGSPSEMGDGDATSNSSDEFVLV